MNEYKSELLKRFFGKTMTVKEQNRELVKMLEEVCDKNDLIKDASRKYYDKCEKLQKELDWVKAELQTKKSDLLKVETVLKNELCISCKERLIGA